jgi:hypothetical protein
MRLSRHKKATPIADPRDERRKARAAASTLRVACPEAALVRVELSFQPDSQLAHARQTFHIYPPAKAHFIYVCPFGDCDGVYDLNGVAFTTLQAGRVATRGTLTCPGHRPRYRSAGRPCELVVTYSISIQRNDEPDVWARHGAKL